MRILAVLCAALVSMSVAAPAAVRVFYVDDSAPPGGDGTSWTSAYNLLQTALALADEGDEIRVAQGTYYPDRDEETPGGSGAPFACFELMDDVTLLGGYAGRGADDPDARDVWQYETILSGDIGEPGYRYDNSCNVVYAFDVAATAILDGFTIRDGYATIYYYYDNGAGIYIDGGSPTIQNCTIRDNATDEGAGYIEDVPIGCGAGVFCWQGAPTFFNCVFRNNETGSGLDAACNGDFPYEATAGGIYCSGSLALVNCTVVDNIAGPAGAGPLAGVAGQGGGLRLLERDGVLANCILWANTAALGPQISGLPSVLFSCVQGGWAGLGNISADPAFVAPANGDYHLRPGSPCIDAGLNAQPGSLVAVDRDDWPRFMDNPNTPDTDVGTPAVDMGAYEFWWDCNDNDVPDPVDIAAGTSRDCNRNGIPDECEPDRDGDGVIDACDGCPDDPRKSAPGDCGCGTADTDSDGDGLPDCVDNCPAVANPDQSDTDGNGVGDACEPPQQTRPSPPEELSAFIRGLTELLARGSDARSVPGFDDSLRRLSSVVDGVPGNSLLSVDESGRPYAQDPNVVSAHDLERLGIATGLRPAASTAMLGVSLLRLHRARRGIRRP